MALLHQLPTRVRREFRQAALVGSTVATLLLGLPATTVSADTYLPNEAGQRIEAANEVIKTAIVPLIPAIPEVNMPHSGCKVWASGVCVLYLPVGTAIPADSYQCSRNPDQGCTGQDPIAAGCTGDATSVQSDGWKPDYGPVFQTIERWSAACQSNWSQYESNEQQGLATYVDYGDHVSNAGCGCSYWSFHDGGTGYPGTAYPSSGYYPNTEGVYGNMLYGGHGVPCVMSGGESSGYGLFETRNCV